MIDIIILYVINKYKIIHIPNKCNLIVIFNCRNLRKKAEGYFKVCYNKGIKVSSYIYKIYGFIYVNRE